MYLRISDLIGRDNWTPSMGDFRRDTTGNWWFQVVGKGNKAARISVRDDYVHGYLARYRRHLGLPPLPSPQERTPLIGTLKGRAGLSDRYSGKAFPELSTACSSTSTTYCRDDRATPKMIINPICITEPHSPCRAPPSSSR